LGSFALAAWSFLASTFLWLCRRDISSSNVGAKKTGSIAEGRRKKEEGRRKKEEGRRKKEEGRRKKEEGRRKKEEEDRAVETASIQTKPGWCTG
jgi:hypothetical protein